MYITDKSILPVRDEKFIQGVGESAEKAPPETLRWSEALKRY